VQAAELGDHVFARPQMQVICVGDEHLDADLFEVIGADGFHRRLGAHGNKRRSINIAVGGFQNPAASAGVGVATTYLKEMHHHQMICNPSFRNERSRLMRGIPK